MSIEAAGLSFFVIFICVLFFFYFGYALNKKWWLVLVLPLLAVASALYFTLQGSDSDAYCRRLSSSSCSVGTGLAFVASWSLFIVAIASLVFGLPLAYLGHKKRSKKR